MSADPDASISCEATLIFRQKPLPSACGNVGCATEMIKGGGVSTVCEMSETALRASSAKARSRWLIGNAAPASSQGSGG